MALFNFSIQADRSEVFLIFFHFALSCLLEYFISSFNFPNQPHLKEIKEKQCRYTFKDFKWHIGLAKIS